VSNTATCGTPAPSTARAAAMPRRLAGLWSGARSIVSSMPRSTSSSIRTERVNRSPPWTTRCPTASMSARPPSPTPLSSETSQATTYSTAARWSRSAAVVFCAAALPARSVSTASPPNRSMVPRASFSSVLCVRRSWSVRTSWNLTDEEPTFSTRTFMRGRPASE
jgi:hypothetical protein